MGLLPDKPNPPGRSIAQPSDGTRRCTKCLLRKHDAEFRWLNRGIRRASRCKLCERAAARAVAKISPIDFLFGRADARPS